MGILVYFIKNSILLCEHLDLYSLCCLLNIMYF